MCEGGWRETGVGGGCLFVYMSEHMQSRLHSMRHLPSKQFTANVFPSLSIVTPSSSPAIVTPSSPFIVTPSGRMMVIDVV